MPATTSVIVVEPNRWPRRLMVILHADMVGYSRRIGRDDSGTFLRLRALRRDIIDPALAAHHGALRSTAGDSLFVTFESIDEAIDAALAIQRNIPEYEAPHEDQIQFRIGINLGDAIVDDRDMYGDGINVAARLQSACPPGRICVSRAIRDHARQRRDMRFEPLGPLSLKNIDKPVDAFVLAPQTPAGVLRRLAGAIPTWRVRKAYAILAAIIPLVSLIAVGTRYYADLGASRSQREQVAALTAAQQAIAEAIARDKSVPLTVIARILSRLEESAAANDAGAIDPVGELQKRLEAKVGEFVALRQQVRQLTGDEPALQELRLQADTALSRGDLARAQSNLRHAASLEAAATKTLAGRAQTRAAEAAALLEKSARISAVTLHYREAAADFENAAAIVAPFDRHEQWRLEMQAGAMLLAQGEEFSDQAAIASAIEHYNTALSLISRAREASIWAQNQNDLGRALRASGDLQWGNAQLEQSVSAFEAALEIRTRDNDLAGWIETQSNLALALWRLGERETGTATLNKSADVLTAVLQVQTRTEDPLRWADAENTLGSVLGWIGRRENGTARLEEALAAHRAASDEYERRGRSLAWAGIQNNIGVRLLDLGIRETGTDRLEQALAAFHDSLAIRTRERVPLAWSWTTDNLGLALWRLGQREEGTARLEEAVAMFRAALEERTQTRSPRNWGITQQELGEALVSLGGRQVGTTSLQEAVGALHAAVAQTQRDVDPLAWAAAQHKLGAALTELGSRQGDTAALEAAVAAFRNALAERRRDRFPALWAETESALGWVLMRLGERETGTARFEEAVAAQRAALEERPRQRGRLDWFVSQTRLGATLMRLGEREPGTERLREAVAIDRMVLEQNQATPAGSAVLVNLGVVLRDIGEREADTALLTEAAALHRAALNDPVGKRSPYLWAKTGCNLGLDLLRLGQREPGAVHLEEAAAALTTCLATLSPDSAEPFTVIARQELAAAQAEIDRRNSKTTP